MESEGGRDPLVGHAIDHLDFDEVVARPDRAALVGPAGQRPLADELRHRSIDAALGLGAGDVIGRGQAEPLEIRDALPHEFSQLIRWEHPAAPLPHAHGDVSHQLVDQRHDQRPGVGEREVRPHEPHAAVDVVADAPGRDDAAGGRVGAADAPDTEAVAPVDVGHRQARQLDPRQEGDVGHLLGRPVAPQQGLEPLVGEDQPIDEHPRPGGAGNPERDVVEPLERPVVATVGEWSGGFHGS
jgi:hypothetical protein